MPFASPRSGLAGILSLAGSGLSNAAARALADRLGRRPLVATERFQLFIGGWASAHRAPDGLCIAGSCHLVGREELNPELRQASALEVVAALYRSAGEEALKHLHGQFCLLIWDPAREKLLLATDRFATRVLYHAEHAGCLFFADSLEIFPQPLREEIDHQAVLEYFLYTTIPHPQTPFRHIRKLPAAHLLAADRSSVRVKPYWDISYREHRNGSTGDWARHLRRELEAAVRRYARAEDDVASTGAFLSGGTDSSTVAGMLAGQSPARTQAFSIGYDESGYDELAYARSAATWFNLNHYEHRLTPDEALAALPEIVSHYEEPFGNSSALPTLSCARRASERGIRVLFAGDGGDEIFGGNERYRTDAIFSLHGRLPALLRRVSDPIVAAFPEQVPVLGHARRYVRRASIPNPRRMFSYNPLLAEPAATLLSPEFLANVEPSRLLAKAEGYFNHLPPGTSELNRLLYLDLKLAIADNDIRKVSGTAELAGVAVRYPLLDTRLVEFAGSIPSGLKLRRLQKRYLFKRALADFLPPTVLSKPKHGFGVPVALWMRTHRGWRELAGDLLGDRRTRQRGFLLPAALERLWNDHQRESSAFFGDVLWPVLMLELWYRRHVDGGGA